MHTPPVDGIGLMGQGSGAAEPSGAMVEPEADGVRGASGEERSGGGSASGLLPEFLAERDEPCPHCGYNLRGVRAGSCPECGKAIRLGLIGPGRFAGYGLAIVLGLLWVLLASGMNAAREGRSVYLSAQAGANPFGAWVGFTGTAVTITGGQGRVTTWSSTNGGPPVVTTTPAPTVGGGVSGGGVGGARASAPAVPGGVTITIPPGSPGGAIARGAPIRGTAQSAGGPKALMPLPQVAFPAVAGTTTPGALAWGAVTPAEWARLGWWVGLGLLALAGLMVMLVLWRRKRQPGRGAVRVMGVWAGLVFLAYSGYHVQNFVREAWTW